MLLLHSTRFAGCAADSSAAWLRAVCCGGRRSPLPCPLLYLVRGNLPGPNGVSGALHVSIMSRLATSSPGSAAV